MTMTIARKLWLGFGVFIFFLVITTLTIEAHLRVVEKDLERLTWVEEPTRMAAYEMGMSVADVSLGVLKYLDTADPKYRKQAEEGIADFGLFRAQYDRLTETRAEKELGKKLAAVFKEYIALGEILMNTRDAKGIKRFLDLRLKLNSILEHEILTLAQQDLRAAGEQTHRAIVRTHLLILTMVLIGLIIGIGTATVISKEIIGSVHRLIEGTREIARGVLDYKIDVKTKDEIGELGFAFNRMTEKLQQAVLQKEHIEAEKLELVREISHGSAHEVKNVLGILQQGEDYLATKVKSNGSEISVVLTGMNEAISRAKYVVSGLSDIAGQTKQKMDICKSELIPRIEQSLLLLKPKLEEFHIHVGKEFQADLPAVKVDRNRIEQVFVNLFLNAIEAMPEGGELWVRAYIKKLTEVGPQAGLRKDDRFRLGETAVVVDIEDTGPGIPEDILSRIFLPFFTTRRDRGKVGLGLSVTRSILEMHDGTIQISNREQGGIRATVMLKV